MLQPGFLIPSLFFELLLYDDQIISLVLISVFLTVAYIVLSIRLIKQEREEKKQKEEEKKQKEEEKNDNKEEDVSTGHNSLKKRKVASVE